MKNYLLSQHQKRKVANALDSKIQHFKSELATLHPLHSDRRKTLEECIEEYQLILSVFNEQDLNSVVIQNA